MLDHHDGQACVAIERAQSFNHAINLRRAQARHGLVEQQHCGPRRQRARHFQPFAIGQRQRRGALVALVPKIEGAQGLLRAREGETDIAFARHDADGGVFVNAQRGKRPHDLKRARQAAHADLIGSKAIDARAVEFDTAGVSRERTRDEAEQGRLARAIRPDDREDRARFHSQRHIVDRDQSAEPSGNAVEAKQTHRRPSPMPRRRAMAGQTPPGASAMMIIKPRP